MLARSQLTDKQKKKLNKIKNNSQNKNKEDLVRLSKYNRKRNNYSVSKVALQELSNPDLVYILGGSQTDNLVYIHSYTKTWETGLHTATYNARRMLKELVSEQKKLINTRIKEINQLWSNIYKAITEHEKKYGNNIQINSWDSFINYFNSLPSFGQSTHLQEILQYKMAMSALSNIQFWDWKGQTLEEFVQKLIAFNFIDEKQSKAILNGDITVKNATKDAEKILREFMEKNRKSFIGDASVSDWLGSLQENSITRQTYTAEGAQITLKPNAKQLGFITEHALQTDKNFNKIVTELSKKIVDSFVNNTFQNIEYDLNRPKSSSGVYRVGISGETNQNKGGISNAIQKGDLATILDLGEVLISIPSSVKLSMRIKEVNLHNNITTITAEDLFSASASSTNLDFSEINKNVGSEAYNKHSNKLNSLIRYVYTNASSFPSSHLRDIKLFNNSIIYYLSWLELCLEICGNPSNTQQLAIALESIGTIHNTADILQTIAELTRPSEISKYIKVYTNPLDGIIYNGSSAVIAYQNQKRHLIAKLWENHLEKNGPRPNYKLIYGRLFNILSTYSNITKKKMPSLSLSYQIATGNSRQLVIKN